MVAGFLIAGILFNMHYQYSYEKDYLSEFTDSGEALEKLETGVDRAVLSTDDPSVYRYDQMDTNSSENSSMQMGTNSTAYYFSVASSSIANFFDEMYLNTPWEQHYNNLDGRTILDRLASVKYFVVKKGKESDLPYGYSRLSGEAEKNGKTYLAYADEDALPLGYTYDSWISREDYDKMTVTEKQQALLQGVVLDDSSLPETETHFNDREVSYYTSEGKGCRLKNGKVVVTQENAQLKLVFKGEEKMRRHI